MAWTEWVMTDDDQWQRKDGAWYEMYDVVALGDWERFLVVHGRFCLDEWRGERNDMIETYGYEGNEEELTDDLLAECVFETYWMEFDYEAYDTIDEAHDAIQKAVRG